MSTIFSDLQKLVVARIMSSPLIKGPPVIPVVTQKDGDVEDALDVLMAQESVGMVVFPVRKGSRPARKRPLEVNGVIRIFENTKLMIPGDGTPSGLDLLSMLWATLDDYLINDMWQPLECFDFELVGAEIITKYDLKFRTQIELATTTTQ